MTFQKTLRSPLCRIILIEAAVFTVVISGVFAMWAIHDEAARLRRVSAERSFHQQAVDSGHAEWVAQPDGSSEFRWLPPGYPQIELGEEVD